MPLFIAPYILAPSNPDRMYFGSSTLFRSDNGGDNIEVLSDIDNIITNPIYAMEVSPIDADVLYCATGPYPVDPLPEEPQVVITRDGGLTFEVALTDLPNRIVNDVTVDPNIPSIAYLTLSGFGSDHLFKTIDFGRTWTSIDNGLPDVPGNAILVNPNNTDQLFYGNDISVYISNDAGETWATLDAGLPNAAIVMDIKIAAEDNSIWIATHGNGIYRRNLDQVEVSTQSIAQIEDLSIYPNPVNYVVNIKTELPTESVSYEIIDQLGRLIQKGQILNSQIEVPNLPNGLYVLKASAKNKVFTAKFVKI